MSKKLLWIITSIFTFSFFSGIAVAQTHSSLFEVPDSVCAGAFIYPKNVINGAQSYDWSFCPPDLFSTPEGINTGALPTLTNPTNIIIVQQDGISYTYHLNGNGDLLRMRYSDGLAGGTSSLAIVGQVPNPAGLYALKDNDGKYHIFVVSGVDSNTSTLTRFDFENGVQTYPTDTTAMVIPALNGPKQILVAEDAGKWYGFTFNRKDELIKLSFGADLTAVPTPTNLGNINNNFDKVTGMAAISELGNWHIFVTNKGSNSIDRISFGNSLDNVPFVINLGDFNNKIKRPIGIAITKGCEAYYGYVLNNGTQTLVALKWDAQSIASVPNSMILGNMAGFYQPKALSGIAQENGTIYMFGLNNDNSISKIIFPTCDNANIPHSNEQYPHFSYDQPGDYTIYLTINQGLPTVEMGCHTIHIATHPPIALSHDTLICEGDTIQIHALSFGNDSIKWTPNYNIDTTYGGIVNVWPINSTKYVATTYFDTSYCVVPDTIRVTVSKIHADAGPDRVIKDGATTILGGATTTLGPQYSYLWTPDIDITGSTGTPITEARPPYDITYYLHISNSDGCAAIDSVNVRVPCDDIHLPNAFAPNSTNGQINKFGLLNQQLVKINYFKIYDRWGKEVFSTTNPNEEWDGKIDGEPAPMGVYVWEVDGYCANTGVRYRKSGTVTLIR